MTPLFIKTFMTLCTALNMNQTLFIPPQVCTAQAWLESGEGKFAPHYNYFGLMGKRGLLKFATQEEGLQAYRRTLENHFTGAFRFYDPKQFAKYVSTHGYATDPHYLAKILLRIELIREEKAA